MVGPERNAAVALGLMRKALELLDRMGETGAACRLQSAIDTLLQNRPMQPGDEIDNELAALIAAIPLDQ